MAELNVWGCGIGAWGCLCLDTCEDARERVCLVVPPGDGVLGLEKHSGSVTEQ